MRDAIILVTENVRFHREVEESVEGCYDEAIDDSISTFGANTLSSHGRYSTVTFPFAVLDMRSHSRERSILS